MCLRKGSHIGRSNKRQKELRVLPVGFVVQEVVGLNHLLKGFSAGAQINTDFYLKETEYIT